MEQASGSPPSLEEAIHHAARLLPAQGPISVFIHHNPLHAFEHLPFEDAVVDASRRFGAEPFLTHERYREEMGRGGIRREDVEAVLEEETSDPGAIVGGLVSRRELRLVLLENDVVQKRGAALAWTLAETREIRRNQDLFRAALDAARRASSRAPTTLVPIRHRDLILAAGGPDTDALVHPVAIRLAAAFLDQGIAYWPMPGRESGFAAAVAELYGGRRFPSPWMTGFAAELGRWRNARSAPLDTVRESLEDLGVPESEWPSFLEATLLALRGFGGMIRQIEARPDRVPVEAPRASIVEFLAVRLLLDRSVIAYVARKELSYSGPIAGLRQELLRRSEPAALPTVEERAYPLFQVARLLGRGSSALEQLSEENVADVLNELEGFTDIERRRLLHLAYERRHRVELLDALSWRAAEPPGEETLPWAQAIFCLDEREESIRRHLEEIDSRVETFGTAGFFGVVMYYRGVGDAHARPLCPIALEPEHEVEERVEEESPESFFGLLEKKSARRFFGRLLHSARIGSRTFTRGTILTAFLGIGSSVPLAFRVLFPRLTARLRQRMGRVFVAPRSRLALERDEARSPSLGKWSGFEVSEMASIVERVLVEIGIASAPAPLVLVVGHGSSSLNNPHESAHDCGACGGGRGGPNARAFAQMANDPRVRSLLRERSLFLTDSTWFVGAYHNTCDDSLVLYEVDRVPLSHKGKLGALERALDRARARNAHERCRRFELLPKNLSAGAALAHVEARSEDLAQTRPEYGHATNAACIVGRRSRTRGLFLDRRAFLVSYDPTRDDAEANVLTRILGAAIPVVAGINLEYYFSYVDPVVYGCGTKLPHNVTALLGVMDGHRSDLRPGLPWQMVEIHSPVRLLIVVETEAVILDGILRRNRDLAALADNRWVQLATLSPSASEISVRGPSGFTRHEPSTRGLPSVDSSREWYQGSLAHLPPARVIPVE